MKYEKPLPEWLAEGLEPPQSKKVEGWKQGDRPPAEWWNWQMNKTYEALKELQEKAALNTDLNALDQRQTNHENNKNNPHNVTKQQVGLGNVDNVKQASKAEFDAHLADKAKYATFIKTVNQSIPNDVVTQITFQNKVSSNGEDFCELDQETGRIKILEDGIYEVVAYVTFEPNPNGDRGLVVLNYELSTPSIASQHYIFSSNFAQINAGSLLNVAVRQTSGGSIDLLTNYTLTKVRRVVKT